MQLEAIYNNGRLEFTQPVRFAQQRFVVKVDVPESALLPDSTTTTAAEPEDLSRSAEGHSIREDLDRILGEFAHARPAATAAQDKAAWHAHLEEKYLKRD